MNSSLPSIPEISVDGIPNGNRNTVQYWGFFEREKLEVNQDCLLMLDLDFGRKCSLHCPSCFRKQNPVDDKYQSDLTYHQLLNVIYEARSLGLQTVKICGAGEPLEQPELLEFARELTSIGVGLSIFTKAHVLGDDRWVEKLFGAQGISSAIRLCEEFFKLKTSFLVSFQSAYPKVQDNLVGGVIGYSLKRNRGLEVLCEVGFNTTEPTRLALCTNPLMQQNYDEILTLYCPGSA